MRSVAGTWYLRQGDMESFMLVPDFRNAEIQSRIRNFWMCLVRGVVRRFRYANLEKDVSFMDVLSIQSAISYLGINLLPKNVPNADLIW